LRTVFLSAVIIYLLYAAFVLLAPPPARVVTQSQWQTNRQVLEDYRQLAKAKSSPPVVIVGSSLTRRLRPAQRDQCPLNLGLDGDSALTGLEAILRVEAPPKIVFVEINVPDRGLNEQQIAISFGLLSAWSGLFRVANAPVNIALSRIAGPERPVPDATEAAFRSAVDQATLQYAVPMAPASLNLAISRYRAIAVRLAERGVEVKYFEMPVEKVLVQSPRANAIRAAFTREFGSGAFVSSEELAAGAEIRTNDGVHLSAKSADWVASEFSRLTQANCR
jgi:hypothetical protein